MNKATPVGQLPYIPPQQGSNDPRVLNEVMNDVYQDVPKTNSQPQQENFLSDALIKETILVMALYILVNSEFINNLLVQYIPTLVQITETHFQTTVIKAILLGATAYSVKRFLM
jgi:hypothetical protein